MGSLFHRLKSSLCLGPWKQRQAKQHSRTLWDAAGCPAAQVAGVPSAQGERECRRCSSSEADGGEARCACRIASFSPSDESEESELRKGDWGRVDGQVGKSSAGQRVAPCHSWFVGVEDSTWTAHAQQAVQQPPLNPLPRGVGKGDHQR